MEIYNMKNLSMTYVSLIESAWLWMVSWEKYVRGLFWGTIRTL